MHGPLLCPTVSNHRDLPNFFRECRLPGDRDLKFADYSLHKPDDQKSMTAFGNPNGFPVYVIARNRVAKDKEWQSLVEQRHIYNNIVKPA
jgi:lipocalin